MLSDSIRTFADETSIFGLNLFKRQRSAVEIVFWCVFVAIFACYTTKNVFDIAGKFLDEETTTTVFQESPKVVYLADPMICVYSKPIAAYTPSRDMPTEAIVEQFAVTGDLNASNFLHVLNFMHNLQNVEQATIQPEHDAHEQRLSKSVFLERTIPETVLILKTFEHLAPSRDLLTNLTDFVVLKFCNALQVRLRFSNSTDDLDHPPYQPLACKRDDVLFPRDALCKAMGSICVKLEKQLFFFRTGNDRVNILLGMNSSTLRESVGLDKEGTTTYFLADGHYQLTGRAITDYDSYISILLHKSQTYYVRVNTIYTNLDLRRRRCDPDRQRSGLCKGICESGFFLDSYGCWPSIFIGRLGRNLIRRCEAIDYLANFSFAARDPATLERLLDCRARCSPPCSKPAFAASAENVENAEPNEATYVEIYLQTHVYTRVKEKLENDIESFLSSLGGALGLWLGASFASIIHIPIFVIPRIVRYFGSKRKQTEASSVELVESSETSVAQAERRETSSAGTVSSAAVEVSTLIEKTEAHEHALLEIRAQVAEILSKFRVLEIPTELVKADALEETTSLQKLDA